MVLVGSCGRLGAGECVGRAQNTWMSHTSRTSGQYLHVLHGQASQYGGGDGLAGGVGPPGGG